MTDSGIDCSFSKTADYTKLCSTADPMEGQAAIHREQDKLENWPTRISWSLTGQGARCCRVRAIPNKNTDCRRIREQP